MKVKRIKTKTFNTNRSKENAIKIKNFSPKRAIEKYQNKTLNCFREENNVISIKSTFNKQKQKNKIQNISILIQEDNESMSLEEPSTNIQMDNNTKNNKEDDFYDFTATINHLFMEIGKHEPLYSNFLNFDLGNLSSEDYSHCSFNKKESLQSLELIDFDKEVHIFNNSSSFYDLTNSNEDNYLDNIDEFASPIHAIRLFHTRESKLLNKEEHITYLQMLLRYVFHRSYVDNNNRKIEIFPKKRADSIAKNSHKAKRNVLLSGKLSVYKNISKEILRCNSLIEKNH